uniref:Protein kinase domain-containing protein n=1 Tax=viral metagenome TaxID=1070528 RepID=A0A6C0AEZ6_9ZZZZ
MSNNSLTNYFPSENEQDNDKENESSSDSESVDTEQYASDSDNNSDSESDTENNSDSESDVEGKITIFKQKNLIENDEIEFSKQVPEIKSVIKTSTGVPIKKDTKIGDFKISEFVEENQNFKVYTATKKNDQLKYKIKFADYKKIENEKEILEKINDFAYSLVIPEDFYSKKNKNSYIITEYFTQNLKDLKNEINIIEVSRNILSGLEWLHSKGIIYVNLSPNNFTYEKGEIKFINFEFSQFCQSDKIKEIDEKGNVTREDFTEGQCQGNLRKEKDIMSFGDKNYLSINIQKGGRALFVDDIESLVYLIYFLNDELTWKDSKYMIKEKETYISKNENLNKILDYVKNLDKDEKIDYYIISKQLKKTNKISSPKKNQLEIKKNTETEAQYKFRLKLYEKIRNIEIVPEGIDISDTGIMKLAELMFSRLWYNVKFGEKTEFALDTINELIVLE